MPIIVGFLGKTSGKVAVAGHGIREESFEARQNIGYMPEAVPLCGVSTKVSSERIVSSEDNANGNVAVATATLPVPAFLGEWRTRG